MYLEELQLGKDRVESPGVGIMVDDEFDFWQDHSERVLVMSYLWDRRKRPLQYDATAMKRGACGDTITMYLNVNDKKVQHLFFEIDGCLNTNACCNVVAEFVEGNSIESCWAITPEQIIQELQTLPEDHHHCAELAVGTLYLALSDYDSD